MQSTNNRDLLHRTSVGICSQSLYRDEALVSRMVIYMLYTDWQKFRPHRK